MSYVKLDTAILNSTLWIDREAREIFITALLMAVPKEIQASPQIEVRSLAPTGWIVPGGHYGFVEAAGPGICRQAGLDLTAGLSALERLGDVDLESRSCDFEGRRLARIDGGYVVLNYMAYRDKDHTAAARQKRFRERNAVTSQSNAVTALPVTQAEANADTKKTLTPLVGLKPDGGRNVKQLRKAEALTLLEFLNGKARKHFRPVAANLGFIEARLAEGISLQDLKTLTVRKCGEWLGTDQEKYLRPETLYNAKKCHSYLGEIPPEDRGDQPCNAPLAIAPSDPRQSPARADGSPPTSREASAMH